MRAQYIPSEAGGRLASTTTPRGSFAFGYDSNDRLTSIDAPGAAHDVRFEYDDSDNRTVVENSFVRDLYEVDLANRLFRRRETVTGEPERQILYTYDGWDNLSSITYPSGIQVNYTYDLAGRATSVTCGLVETSTTFTVQDGDKTVKLDGGAAEERHVPAGCARRGHRVTRDAPN